MSACPPPRHGVARIDGEVEERVLELAAIHEGLLRLADDPASTTTTASPSVRRISSLNSADEPPDVRPPRVAAAAGARRRAGFSVSCAPEPGGVLRLRQKLDLLRLAAAGLRSISRLPRITVSRLLKSWAMPPVSWPIASIFWDWRSSCSICAAPLDRG